MQGLNWTIQVIHQIQSRLAQPVRHHPPVFLGPVPRHQLALFQPVHQTRDIRIARHQPPADVLARRSVLPRPSQNADRKSTRLNSSHANISYAGFCLKKNKSLFSKGVTVGRAGRGARSSVLWATVSRSWTPRLFFLLTRRQPTPALSPPAALFD